MIKQIKKYGQESLMAYNLNIWYQIGSIIGIILTIQIITGIILTYNYTPEITKAFTSIDKITREITKGYIIRTIHINGAALMFILVYIHIYRGLLYGSYTRKVTWNIGIIIIILMIITAFIGYSLVYGQMSYWGIAVITNIITIIPKYGKEMVEYIYGGYNIGSSTIRRFYSIHYILPLIIVGLTISHIISLHKIGGSNPLGISNITSITLIKFSRYYTIKDILGILIILSIIIIIIYKNPYYLSHTDNFIAANTMVTPSHIIPEVYLLGYFAILRSIPNKTLGVIILIISIISLGMIPILHKGIYHTTIYRPISRYALYIYSINYIILSYIGQTAVSSPYIKIGQILIIIHISYIYIITPLVSTIETLTYIYIFSLKGEQ